MGGEFAAILFAEFVGVAGLFARAGDDAAEAIRREQFSALRDALDGHGGRVVRSTGDGLMAAFPSAVSAVRCAVEMQRAASGAGGLELCVGLEAGEPLPHGDDLHGTPVILARGLCDAAGAGEILASEIVCKIAGPRVTERIEPLERLRVPGVGDRVTAARVRWRKDDQSSEPAPPPADVIRVVVADDQRLLRAGFRVILDAEPDITVVGEASDGRTAVDVVARRRPDVVLMDIRMPELDGLQAAERILSDPELGTTVLMLTTFDLGEYVYEALRIGASGFLLKDTPSDRLLDAVRVVAAGDALLAPSITRRLIEQFARAARPQPGTVPAALAELSARELEVLRLVARGLSNAEVAAELVLGENTIKTHVAHVLGKLGLRDRVQAVVVAYETGLVAPELIADERGPA
jgi:DNA-binding NarL/FixJ family response regulator/class 3 adenylate cyclase